MGSRYDSDPHYVEDDDDQGWGSKSKWVPPSQRSHSSNAEVEDELRRESDALTDETLGLRRITEQIKGVGGQTLVTLHHQGQQICSIHHKTVQTEQELQKGERLLSKLGGVFSFYKPKIGKKVTGPKDYGDDTNGREDRGSRALLGLEENRRDKAGSRPKTQGMSAMEQHEAERKFQDNVLDDVSGNLDDIKMMAEEMGNEMDRQGKQLDDLNADLTEVGNRVRQDNRRADRLLGRR